MTTRILIPDLEFPEGPAFDLKGGIWLVEKEAGNLIYYKDERYHRVHVGGHPNGIALDSQGNIWFCDSKQNAIRYYNPENNQSHTIVDTIDGEALKMPNDLCFDSEGNLLFSCPGDSLDDGSGYICVLGTGGQVHKIHSGMYYPNGLAFTADYSTLYIAETGSKWIWRSKWDVKSQRLYAVTKFAYAGGKVGPDGIALDEEGNLHIAVYGDGQLIVLDPCGALLSTISLPYSNPTNCALDPAGLLGIVVTEAEKGQLLQLGYDKKGLPLSDHTFHM